MHHFDTMVETSVRWYLRWGIESFRWVSERWRDFWISRPEHLYLRAFVLREAFGEHLARRILGLRRLGGPKGILKAIHRGFVSRKWPRHPGTLGVFVCYLGGGHWWDPLDTYSATDHKLFSHFGLKGRDGLKKPQEMAPSLSRRLQLWDP